MNETEINLINNLLQFAENMNTKFEFYFKIDYVFELF